MLRLSQTRSARVGRWAPAIMMSSTTTSTPTRMLSKSVIVATSEPPLIVASKWLSSLPSKRNASSSAFFSTASKRRNGSSRSEASRQATKDEAAGLWDKFFAWYSKKLSSHPLLTKSITGGLIAGGGDFMCQVVVEENDGGAWEEWDPVRTGRFAFLGTFFVSPTNHVWYKLLAKKLAPGTTIPQVTKRVILDQFTWTPLYTAIWLSSLWYLEGTPTNEIKTTLQREYMGIMYANWLLWIPAQFANFRLIPLKFQVLFVNMVELVWNAFLSFSATGKGEDEEKGNSRKHKREKKRMAADAALSRTMTTTPPAVQA